MRSTHRATDPRHPSGAGAPPSRWGTVAPRAVRGRDHPALRVLLVDDAPHSRDALAELLRDEGYWVRCPTSAAAALCVMDEWDPDVVITDVASAHLPKGSLLDAAPARLPDARVVVMTPFLDPQTRDRIAARGITTCALPLDLPDLLARLAHWDSDRAKKHQR